ncbi:hypothetical protein Bca4012_083637 [Brassica carinata]
MKISKLTVDSGWTLRLGSQPEIAELVNVEEVTKAVIVTAGQIYAYIKKEFAREGLSNADGKTKATRGPSSLMCPKFGNINVSEAVSWLESIPRK